MQCGKVSYETRAAALKESRRASKRRGYHAVYVYICSVCQSWHLSSNKPLRPSQ